MTDTHDELKRFAPLFAPPERPYEAFLRRRDRVHRNHRITAGVLGLALGLAAILIGSSLLRSSPSVPTEPSPSVPMANGPMTVFGLPGRLRSLTLDGQDTSLVECGGSCTQVSSAAWSPDGSRVAFSPVCAGGCGTAGDPYHGIRVLDLATGTDRLVIAGEFFSPSLDWSADGTKISYVADGRIHIVDADGSNATELPTTDVVQTASWSPDGSRFVYAGSQGLSVIGADGSDPTLVVPFSGAPASTPAFAPAWSPDGTQIVYRVGCDVRTMSPDGTQRSEVVDLTSVLLARRCAIDVGQSDQVVWSPDGSLIAAVIRDQVVVARPDGTGVQVVATRHERSYWYGITWQPVPATSAGGDPTGDLAPLLHDGEVVAVGQNGIDALDPSTGDRRTLAECTDSCVLISRSSVSADGRWLAYEVWTCVATDPCESQAGIWVTNAAGEHHQLTQQCTIDNCPPETWAWSPQGATLGVAGDVNTSRIFTIDPLTQDRTPIVTPDGDVGALAWSPDGTSLAFATSTLQRVDVGTGELTTLTDAIGSVGTLAWSPDGTQLLLDDSLAERNRVIVVKADGSDLRILVDQGAPQGPAAPAWSPDGTRIAYVSTPQEPGATRGHFSFQVWTIATDGSAATRLFDGTCCISDWDGPIWSPDGSRIAFFDDADAPPGRWLVVNVDGSGSPEQIDEVEAQSWRSGG